ncbi:hypothetical protein Syn7502_01286 [Synechococcus sp. PCC 7502]|nr:hypothetical protein Syn7502_01286 [Synechococcus sp. PCC 7502]
MCRVIDTNVLIVANNRESEHASPKCIISCIRWLQNFEKSGILVIDSKWLIINEYKKKVNQSGQPGVGDAFLKWILINRNNPQRCQQVQITQIDENNFAEFPRSSNLEKFDPNDRKFVAVSLTHPAKPAIAIAIDRGWNRHQKPLYEHGIEVEFLCLQN